MNEGKSSKPRGWADLAALIPGGGALMLVLVWVTRDGGYAATRWLPGGLLLLGLLVLASLTTGRGLSRHRALCVAVALLFAFAAWNFLSILWAGSKGDAWDGSNRTLVYAIAFGLFAAHAWRAHTAAVLIGGFSVGVAVIGLVEFLRATHTGDIPGFFIAGRFAEPFVYPNGNAALFLSALWPALYLASRREVPWPVRAVSLASAGVLAQLALLVQSRGSLFAFPVALAIFVAIVPGRPRTVLALAAVGVAAWLAADPLFDVFPAVTTGQGVGPALLESRRALLVSTLGLLALGAVVGLVDRRLTIGERSSRWIGRVVGLGTSGIVAVGIVLLLAAYGNPIDRAQRGWEEFKSDQQPTVDPTSHFTRGLGSKRYDLYRVALVEFERAPLVGIGSENFLYEYIKERRTPETPLHPHSLPLRVLVQNGLVGVVLFLGFLIAAAVAIWRALARAPQFARGVGAAGVVATSYWFVHGTIDWFWEIPALAVPALCWLAVAARLGPDEADASPRSISPGVRRLSRIGFVATAFAIAVAFTTSWIAAKEIQVAASGWRGDPAQAYERLERASSLNRFSERPYLVEAAIAERLDDPTRELRALRGAIERNPNGWYPSFQLAIVEHSLGHRRAALAAIRDARALNPREPLIGDVAAAIRSGRGIDRDEIRAHFRARAALITGERQR